MNNAGAFRSVLRRGVGGGESDVPGALKDSSLLSQRLRSRIEQDGSKGESHRSTKSSQQRSNTHIICTHIEIYIHPRETHTLMSVKEGGFHNI